MSTEKNIFEGQEVLNKFETIINKNKNIITAVFGGLLLIVGGYFGFKYLYLEPKEKEAQEQMFYAQKYLDRDSLSLALNGDKNYPGFLGIIDNYKWTKAANLSYYYAGTILLRQGKFEDAIDHLNSFDGKGTALEGMALGCIGDAYTELTKMEDGLSYYKKAAYTAENEITSPFFLKKAALCLEKLNKTEEAIKLFEELRNKYPNSAEGREADKYIYRLGGNPNS
jgi:tetratricopeptide (TPR) repeat protein